MNQQQDLCIGAWVTLQNLKKAQHLNGRRGVVASELRPDGRFVVKLFPKNENKMVTILPQNLRKDRGTGIPQEDQEYVREFCHNCSEMFKKNQLKLCSRCKIVGYCSEHCQQEHWETTHKQNCKAMKQSRKTMQSFIIDPQSATADDLYARTDTIMGLATLQIDRNDPTKAEEILRDGIEEFMPIVETKPWFVKPLYGRLAVLVGKDKERIDEAVQLMERAIALEAAYNEGDVLRARSQCNLGIFLQQQGDFERAIEAFWLSYELDPKYPAVLYDIGVMHVEMGNREKSEDPFRKLVEIYGNMDNLDEEQSGQAASAFFHLGEIQRQRFNNKLRNAVTTGQNIRDTEFRIELEQGLNLSRKAVELSPNDDVYQKQIANFESLRQLLGKLKADVREKGS